ncbi:MAG: acyl-CoA dehydrogenase family protein [Myxococcota bacterium]
MDFSLSPQEARIEADARAFAREVLAPRIAETDLGAFPFESLREAGHRGLLGVKIPQQYGGLGASMVAHCSVIRELSSVCPSTTVALAVSNMVADMVLAFGSDEQKARYLAPLCSGELVVGAFALSEAGAGSDAASLRTRAVKANRGGVDGYVLDGSKMWITSGDVAGLVLVMAKTDPSVGARGITAFLVDKGTPGLEVGRHEEKLGLRGSSTVSLSFTDLFVPESQRLGPEGAGFSVAMTALDGGRCGIGAQALGMGRSALEACAKHVERRKAADRAQGTEQLTQFRIADMAVKLEAAWWMVLRAASLKDAGKKMSREAAMAKVMGSEAANDVCRMAMELAGAAGLDRTSPIARAFRDVRVSRIYEGTSEVQRLVIARSLVQP